MRDEPIEYESGGLVTPEVSEPSPASRRDLAAAFLRPTGRPHFVRKAAAFLDLSDAELDELESRVTDTEAVPADTFLRRQGDPVRRVLLVVSGALIESVTSPEGGTQNFRFYFPGDSIGGHDIASRHHSSDLRTLTDVRYASVDADQVPPRANGRLTALFFAMRMVEQSILGDRMRTIGRAKADERVLHFMLELNARQRLTEPSVGNRVWCPFSQAEIGDAVGLTNVYVSRMMTKLREDGVLRGEGRIVTITDPERAARRTGFLDRYADVDLSRVSTDGDGG